MTGTDLEKILAELSAGRDPVKADVAMLLPEITRLRRELSMALRKIEVGNKTLRPVDLARQLVTLLEKS